MTLDALPVDLLFRLELTTEVVCRINDGPHGSRVVSRAVGGTFIGPRLSGVVLPGGGDWVTITPERSFTPEGQFVFETDDGTQIIGSGTGRAILQRGGSWLRAGFTFQTGPGDHDWLNHVFAVLVGIAARYEDNQVISSHELYSVT